MVERLGWVIVLARSWSRLGAERALYRFRHCLRHVQVEDAGHDEGWVEFAWLEHVGECLRCRCFHLQVDVTSARVQQAAEHPGESEHVVDLVGLVAAAGRDDCCVQACLGGVEPPWEWWRLGLLGFDQGLVEP